MSNLLRTGFGLIACSAPDAVNGFVVGNGIKNLGSMMRAENPESIALNSKRNCISSERMAGAQSFLEAPGCGHFLPTEDESREIQDRIRASENSPLSKQKHIDERKEQLAQREDYNQYLEMREQYPYYFFCLWYDDLDEELVENWRLWREKDEEGMSKLEMVSHCGIRIADVYSLNKMMQKETKRFNQSISSTCLIAIDNLSQSIRLNLIDWWYAGDTNNDETDDDDDDFEVVDNSKFMQ